MLIAGLVLALQAGKAAAQFRDTIPSQEYYLGIQELYSGRYRDAQRIFFRELQGAVKTLGPGGQVRWVDSICYHAMLGETLFQAGRAADALEQFDLACQLVVQYPNWMMQVEFSAAPRVDPALSRTTPPWGAGGRQFVPGKFSTAYNVAMGRIDNTGVVQQGGVVQQAQYWRVNVVEVLRATSLAIRRRNEILGPLAAFDPLAKRLASQFSRGGGGGPPNHWSSAWMAILRGVAQAGIGESQAALQQFERGLLVAGQFDHPLTCVALVEQGRLAMEAGEYETASQRLADAATSAFLYGDAGLLDDAFRWSDECSYLSGLGFPPATMTTSAQWARRQNLEHVASRLQLGAAGRLIDAEEWTAAAEALAAAAPLLGDARTGVLGSDAAYLAALLECHARKNTGPSRLAAAVAGRAGISLRSFQIALANSMFDAQTLPVRSATDVYARLLGDPNAAEQIARPLESLALMSQPNDEAFERWLSAAVERRDLDGAVVVSDLAKRRRYHAALAWGGRLAALRDLACEPEARITPQQRRLRGELAAKLPELRDLNAAGERIEASLDASWKPDATKEQISSLARLWDDRREILEEREAILLDVALARSEAPLEFPPTATGERLHEMLGPRQAILVFHDTAAGLMGFLVTRQGTAGWNCGPSGRVAALVSQTLRDMGSVDANHEMTTDQLAGDDWRKSARELYDALLGGAKMDPGALEELVVVPDGVVWYVPFEALCSGSENENESVLTRTAVRYCPTASLVMSFRDPPRRTARTGLVVGDAVPGDTEEARAAAVEPLKSSLVGAVAWDGDARADSVELAALVDEAVVLADVETQGAGPLDWSPAPLAGRRGDALEDWLLLAGRGPQRLALPAMHTPAERGGRASRRKGAGQPGDELFFGSCALLDAGAETILLSRWRTGGQTSLELVREFLQEAPHSTASAAWRRSVEVVAEGPLDPANEPRVKVGKKTQELKASHPLFWAAMLVVDTGWSPPPPEPTDPTTPPATPPAADAAGPVPPQAKAAEKEPDAQPPKADPGASVE
jgi:hypothetical protein